VQNTLNRPALEDALIKAGLNQARLAEKLKVSREAVSKWLSGDSFPKPDKLLRIGLLLRLDFNSLVVKAAPKAVPVVCFRKKTNRKTTDEHLEKARETGELLKRLVPYLPNQELTRPPTLKDPSEAYEYVQTVAKQLRQDMKLEGKEIIDFTDLIDKFNQLHAVIIPVLWGEPRHHGNALSIHLPDSQTTWVFLNLDSSAVDFKFWMAHELGHSLAPDLIGKPGESFADHFAQALLFPESQASRIRDTLVGIQTLSGRIQSILDEANRHVISPYTIRLALEGYEKARGLNKTDLGGLPKFMAATTNFVKGYKTIAEGVFTSLPVEPKYYIACTRSEFGSSFFEALAEYGKSESGLEHFIQRVLGVSLADAKALSGELSA